jgi:hypothetical protein
MACLRLRVRACRSVHVLCGRKLLCLVCEFACLLLECACCCVRAPCSVRCYENMLAALCVLLSVCLCLRVRACRCVHVLRGCELCLRFGFESARVCTLLRARSVQCTVYRLAVLRCARIFGCACVCVCAHASACTSCAVASCVFCACKVYVQDRVCKLRAAGVSGF